MLLDAELDNHKAKLGQFPVDNDAILGRLFLSH